MTMPTTMHRKHRVSRGGGMFLVILASWIAAYVVSRAILEREGLSLAARWAAALAPVVVLSGLFALVIRALARADELERLIHLLAAGIALPLVAVTVLAIAMLQHAGILSGRGGAGDIWPFLTCFYLLGYVIARAHYHMDDVDEPADVPTPNEAKP